MTSEGFPDNVIDKTKQIWNGVRLYWESVMAEERKPLAPIKVDPQPQVEVNGDCPMCHAPQAIREIVARSLRCSACGWQPKISLPPAIPRSKLETFQYPDREHRRKFHQSFNDALSRIVGPRR